MPVKKWPPHLELIVENTEEVNRLVEIHQQVAGEQRGRKFGVEVLNKSGVVLLVACWEAFVEELARNSFNFLMKNASSPVLFPNRVLVLAGKSLRCDKDETSIWKLAGDGWKQVLKAHKEDVLRRYITPLNVPDSKRVDEFFEQLLGIRRLSSSWSWAGVSAGGTRRKLDELVTLRHEIAHSVKTRTPVYKATVIDRAHFIKRLAGVMSNRLREFLMERVGKEPWINVNYTGHRPAHP